MSASSHSAHVALLVSAGLLLAGALTFVAAGLTPAEAQSARYGKCYWNGTPPFCNGRCVRGFVVRERRACAVGSRVRCCERLETTGPPPRKLSPYEEKRDRCKRTCLARTTTLEELSSCNRRCMRN